MKQFNFYSLASALLLAGAVGFNSCSSDTVEPGGNPGVAGQVVKTQFAINIPYAKGSGNNAKASTRMTEDNTQAAGATKAFRGIENLRLFTLSSEPSSTSSCTDNIFIGNGENGTSVGTTAGDWRSVYSDVAITVGTKYLALYGFAGNKTNQGSAEIGKLNLPTNIGETKELSDLSFSLAPIHSASISENQNDATNIIDALNSILNAEATYTSGEDSKSIKWSEISNNTDYSTENERKALKGLLDRFTKLTAGSAASCIATINGLITQLGEPTEDQKLRSAIKNKCTSAIQTLSGNTFPRNLNLPDGIAKIKYTTGSGFAYVDEVELGTSNNIDYKKISYPAELTYFVSSEAMASDQLSSNGTGFPAYDTWTNENSNTDQVWTEKGFSKDGVTESTRTVALKSPLRYGVANMKLSVSCATENLDDNAVEQASQSQANAIPVTENGFPVKAVLIGGQPEKVAWDYEPTKNETFKYTIYDTDMNKTKTGSDDETQELEFAARYNGTKTFNYTLVLDNLKKAENETTASEQQDVYITIELENNSGIAFYGKDGLVPANGRFYLVGKIAKEKFTNGITHAFVKDYTTEVNLNINSLKSAYNCIPDLRSSQISLGLAVDLDWKTGIKFDVNIE